MPLLLPEKNDFELTPAGTHVAVCYRVIDLGTQLIEFKGETKKQHKIMIGWELPDELMADGRPFSVHKRYTLSSSTKAALRKDLEAWRGVPFTDEDFGKFDIGAIIGKGCFIGIVHSSSNDNTFANISSIMKLPKGQSTPTPQNQTVYFSLNAFDKTVFDSLSENLKATIAKSPEYARLMGHDRPDPSVSDDTVPELSDEIPF